MLISLFLLLFFGLFTSFIARQRGRDPVGWFMLGMLLGIFAPLLLMILPPKVAEESLTNTEENEDEKLAHFEYHSKECFLKNWFIVDKTAQMVGPLSLEKLKYFWEEGMVHSHSYIWTEGMMNWQKVQEIPGLEDVLTLEPSEADSLTI